MSLTRVKELNGIVGVIDNLGQTVKVGKQQVSTLISRKAATEADKQGIGVDLLHQADNARGIALVLKPAVAELLTYIVDKLGLQGHTCLPYLFVAYVVNGFPDSLVALVAEMLGIEMLSIELAPFVGTPCGEMNTIGYIAYMTLLGIVALPDTGKHLLADLAVQPAHTIHFLRSVAGKG